MNSQLTKEPLFNYNKTLLGCSLSLAANPSQTTKIKNFLGCIRKVKNNKIAQIISHNKLHLNFTAFNLFKELNPSISNEFNPYKYIYPDQSYASSKNEGMDFIGPITEDNYNQIYKHNKHFLQRVPAELYRNSIKDLLEGNKKYIADIFNKNITYINKRKSLKFIKKNNNTESFLVTKSDKMFYIKDNYICFGKNFDTSYKIEEELKQLNKQLNNKSNNLSKKDILNINEEIIKLELKLEKDISYLGKLKIVLPKKNKTSKTIDFNSINSIRIKKDKERYEVSFTYEYINEYTPSLLREDSKKEITSKEELAYYIKELSDIDPKLALEYLENKVLGLDRGITERVAFNKPINDSLETSNYHLDKDKENKTSISDSLETSINDNKSNFLSYSEKLKLTISKLKEQIKYHNKQLKRRTVDSCGYKSSLARYRKLNKKLANVRKNENHQASYKIINNNAFPIIAIEKLNLKGMTRKAMPKINIKKTLESNHNIKLNLTPTQLNELVDKITEFNKENKHNVKYKDIVKEYKIIYSKNNKAAKSGLNESMLNQNHGQLGVFLEYKAIMQGKIVVEVAAHYTSQECNECGNVSKENRVKTKFCCVECGNKDHADINASKVIAKRVYKELLKYAEEIIKKKEVIINKAKAKKDKESQLESS